MFAVYVLCGSVVDPALVVVRPPVPTDVRPDVVDAVDARVVRVVTEIAPVGVSPDGEGSTVIDAGKGSQEADM